MNAPDPIASEVDSILASAPGSAMWPPLSPASSWARLQSVRTLVAEAPELPAWPALLCRLAIGETVIVAAIGQQLPVGRSSTAGLSLPAAGHLSKEHFAILLCDGRCFLRHLSSTNRTALNDAPCEAGHDYPPLDGDAIVAGGVLFAFLAGTEAGQPGT